MDNEPQVFFLNICKIVRNADNVTGSSECYRQLSLLNYSLTEEEISSSLIDLYIVHAFNKTSGLLIFIKEAVTQTRYEKCVIKSFEIIFTLINNFPQKLGPFIVDVNLLCISVTAEGASSKVKVQCLEVLHLGFQKVDKCLENQEHYITVLRKLKNALLVKNSDRVKNRLLTNIGCFHKKFSYLIRDPDEMKNIFISYLDKEMKAKPGEYAQEMVCGIFTGLNDFFDGFPLSQEKAEDRKIIDKLYGYLKMLSIVKTHIKIGNRAALQFLSNHMNFFVNQLFKQYQQWHMVLNKWLDMGEVERKVGVACLKSFFQAVADTAEKSSGNIAKPVIQYFNNGFTHSILHASKKDAKQLSILGLKYFSAALNKHLTQAELNNVFMLILRHFERTYILDSDVNSEELYFLPDYIQCIANFMQYKTLTSSELFCLQRAVVNMIRTFHRLQLMHRGLVTDSLVNTLFYLKKTEHFDWFVENVVYHGVVWSCSHHHISDAELVQDSNKIVTVKNYIPLWTTILKLASDRAYDKFGLYLEDRIYILTKIVNQLVKTLMILINKLDVSVKKKDDVTACDIEEAYNVVHTDDYAIFLNVVDFYQEIFHHIEPEMFEKCICKMIIHMINKCVKYPFVSGFYRLLSFALNVFKKLNLYDRNLDYIANDSELNCVAQDVNNCKEMLVKFVNSLLHKMNDFKDELLISCLQVLLEAPVSLIKNILPACTGVFITIFEVGRSYIALAEMGLKTLTYWQENIDQDEFEDFLLQVVPSLDTYLRSKSLGGLMQTTSVEKRRKHSRLLKKRKIELELEPELVKFQNKVLQFIGTQSSTICEALVSPDHITERSIISQNLYLKVSLPYKDTVLEIYLEPLISRIIDLSLYCSDRKTRIMACELLQAFVMVFLGRTKPLSQRGMEDLEELLKYIAMPLLQLGCDVDQVVEQIFNPLFLQIIHWYTSPTQIRGTHTAVIIEVFMDGITHPTNSRLRDFSGKCVNEFVKWTIKQVNEARISEDPINIKIIVKKMRFFSSHPDITKKLGAALLFNNIYKELREERSMISMFAFEILHIFVTSLALIDFPNDEAQTAVNQIYTALRHLKRIFIEKPQMFRDVDNQRRVPNEIPDPSLVGVTLYLFQQTGALSKYCRDISMEMFLALAPLALVKSETLNTFLTTRVNPNLTVIYEKQLCFEPSINYEESSSSRILHQWLQSVLCAVDGYNFLMSNNLHQVSILTGSEFYKAVNYFITKMRFANIIEALNLIHLKSWTFDVLDKEQFCTLKSTIILGFLKLTNTALSDCQFNDLSLLFWNQKLTFQFLVDCLFTSHRLGLEDDIHLETLTLLLSSVKRKVPIKSRSMFVDCIHEFIKTNLVYEVDLKKNIGLGQRNLVRGLLLIQTSTIDELDINFSEYARNLLKGVMSSFMLNVKNNKAFFVTELPESVLEYCQLVFQLALRYTGGFEEFLKYFYEAYKLQVQTCDLHKDVSLSLYLLLKFREVFVLTFLEKFEVFMENIKDIPAAIEYILFVLDLKHNSNKTHKKSIHGLYRKLLRSWSTFEGYFNTDIEKGLKITEALVPGFNQKTDGCLEILNWVITLLTNKDLIWNKPENYDLILRVFGVLVLIHKDNEDEHETPVCLSGTLSLFSITILEEISKKPENVFLVEKVLTLIPHVKSVEILRTLLDLYSKTEPKNDITKDLQECVKNNISTTQEKMLLCVYEICKNTTKNVTERQKIYNGPLQCIFRTCSINVFESFYVSNIAKIVEGLEDTSNLVEGVVHFLLVELLFLRVHIGSPERMNCGICEAYGNQQLRQKLLKITLDAFKVKVGEPALLRLFKCHAYNALASIISNSVKSANFYDKLFVREEDGEDILWSSIIDTNVSYNFPMELDSIPKQRKILTSIRDELRAKNEEASKHLSPNYIESQRIFNSSLSEDISAFDFTNTILRTNTFSNVKKDKNVEESSYPVEFQSRIELDGTEINNHECMATICGVIQNIFQTGINSIPKEGDDENVTLPSWMKGIQNSLLNKNTHVNIKIFLVKIIDNNIDIFRHYAKWFITPLLQFIVDKCGGKTVNYFITDVFVIVSSWAKSTSPEDIDTDLASQALQFVIENLTNERPDVFKYVLDLVKLTVENWRYFLTAPHATIFGKINHPISDRRIEVGIHLSSVFFANDICPCRESDLQDFFKNLLRILNSELRSIYKPCAETIGLLLQFVVNRGIGESSYISHVNQVLDGFLHAHTHKFALCMEGIALHYTSFIKETHLDKMFGIINLCDQTFKAVLLKLILRHSDLLQNNSGFKITDWALYLEDDNPEIQIVTIEILIKTTKLLEQLNMFKGIISSMCKNVTSSNLLCRKRMYEFLKELYSTVEDIPTDVLEIVKETLIQGLIDSEIDIRDDILQYWTNNPKIPIDIKKKFPYILSELYKTKTEEQFLGYASFFLLDSIKETELDKDIFDTPLEDCNFEEYHLKTNWRLQHPSVVPMFAETFRTVPEELLLLTEGSFDVLRGTQDQYSFAPTQQTMDKQISQVTSLETTLRISTAFSSSTEDSFVNPNQVELSQKYKLPKARFLKDKNKIAQGFALSEVNKQSKKIAKRHEVVREREKKVTIYRKYRKGDFPDIQITLGSVLKPLQMLALYDGELSKILFSVIFNSLSNTVEYDKKFIESVSSSIEFIFTNSKQYNTNLFSTLLDILLKNKTQIRFDPKLIANVCEQCGLLTVGTLILEEYLILGGDDDDGPSTSKKGIASQQTTDVTCWLKLAELYKEMGEWDVVRTIFLEKMNCNEDVQNAIKFESSKQWRKAKDLYIKLLETDLSLERKDFYYESLFKSCAYLGEWHVIPEAIKSTCQDENKVWDTLWDNNWYQQKILPWYIGAQVKNTLFSGNVSEAFLMDLNSSYVNSRQSDYLRSNFSEELCLLWLFQRDTSQAKQYLKNSLDHFLNDWQLLNPMFQSIRYNKILNLRNVVDIGKYLDMEDNLSEDCESTVRQLQKYWSTTQKEYLPSIILSEQKLLCRKLFVKNLSEKLTNLDQIHLVKALKHTKINDLDLNFVDLATEEGNWFMARKYFKPYQDHLLKKYNAKLNMSFGKISHLRSKIAVNNEEKVDALLTAASAFDNLFEHPTSQEQRIIGAVKYFDVSLELSKILSENNVLYLKYKLNLKQVFDDDSLQNITLSSENRLKNNLLNIPESMEGTNHSDQKNNNFIAKALVKLAYYAKDLDNRESDFILYVLRAMRLDSAEARQLFPCILLKDNLGTELQSLFVKETEQIPTWMFLGWIPQLLANLDSNKIFALSKIILRIAKTYPQAITYSYRLSKSNFKFDEATIKDFALELTQSLDDLLLKDDIVNRFLSGLSNVSVPAVSLEYYIKKMATSMKDRDEFMKNRQQMFDNLFGSIPDSRDNTYMLGNMYKSISKLKAEFTKITADMPDKSIQRILTVVNEERKLLLFNDKKNKKYLPPSLLLKDYCPWLANLSANKANLDLEIPGQYTGERMPLVQHHIKISGFLPTVRVMASIRRPIKVTMLGMDAKEYPFLVKFGEDIRQDQRVEQLFYLMNNIFKSDKKQHQILTYQVIPLTSSLGIIQWIENTTSLQDFAQIAIKNDKKLLTAYDSAGNKYASFVGDKGGNVTDVYGKMVLRKDANKIIPFYRDLTHMVPWDILRSSIWCITPSTENFIAFKNNFVKSYAVICACQWILGIGDRHLNNSKICMQNGKVLGIDFGHAFGTATQILPVPELVPIRLTPHLVSLMEPLKERGSFRDILIDCLRSLRENREILLATMNVFIQEPSLDWLENASKFNDDDVTKDSHEWYPNKKVDQAKRKLLGASSADILIEDLQVNKISREYIQAYVKHVRGGQECKRNQLKASEEGYLSVEDQVDSLIDHATDYNLLGRMFSGWSPWV